MTDFKSPVMTATTDLVYEPRKPANPVPAPAPAPSPAPASLSVSLPDQDNQHYPAAPPSNDQSSSASPTTTSSETDFSLTNSGPSQSRLLTNSNDPLLHDKPIEDFETLNELLNAPSQVSPISSERMMSVTETLKLLQTPPLMPTKMTARKCCAFRDNCCLCQTPGNEDCLIGCEFSDGGGSYWVHSYCKDHLSNLSHLQ